MRKYIAPLVGAFLLLSALAASAGSINDTVFRNFVNGLSPRGGLQVIYCGQNAENGTIYFSPQPITSVAAVLADTVCDALDGGTEATQDLVLSATTGLRPIHMACITDATLGSGETLAFQLRASEASIPDMSCSLAASETACDVSVDGRWIVGPSVPTAVQAIQVSNNSDDNAKCVVTYAIH